MRSVYVCLWYENIIEIITSVPCSFTLLRIDYSLNYILGLSTKSRSCRVAISKSIQSVPSSAIKSQ